MSIANKDHTFEAIINSIIAVTLLISLLINVIVKSLAHVDNIASLPFISALVLILLSVELNVLAGSIPSKMAAKKDPVESLRNE